MALLEQALFVRPFRVGPADFNFRVGFALGGDQGLHFSIDTGDDGQVAGVVFNRVAQRDKTAGFGFDVVRGDLIKRLRRCVWVGLVLVVARYWNGRVGVGGSVVGRARGHGATQGWQALVLLAVMPLQL